MAKRKSLRELEVKLVGSTPPPPPPLTPHVTRQDVRGLDTLVIQCQQCINLDELLPFIDAPDLLHLELNGVTLKDISGLEKILLKFPQLTTLKVPRTDAFIDAYVPTVEQFASPLKSISLGIDGICPKDNVSSCLQVLGSLAN